ncbi:probable leucine-rich repeat receptor-like protein kinase At1g68400 [Typha angustifolia]|uniref:probable leucine-rich repeat receptor-like protein kinase At1g68400 n=1 Tax=Typha angustifolia TaxID=59011 RepID=UPI003C2F6D8C
MATSREVAVNNPDLHRLLSFKSSADTRGVLSTWVGLDPCSGSWVGIKCFRGRVASIYLDNSSLVGGITPLLGVRRLRVLSLRRNALNDSLPSLNNLTHPRLRHLLISHNQFSGTLNISLPSLVSLRVEHNNFSGGLEGLQLPILKSFNVSENNLAGEISSDLSQFPTSSFEGNLALCGRPLRNCINTLRLSNTSTDISSPIPSITSVCSNKSLTKLGLTALLAIGVGDILVISVSLAIIVGIYVWLRRKLFMPPNTTTSLQLQESDQGCIEEKEKNGGLVCFEGGEDLKLDCLLKASAEVLGKGVSGSTYKAILDDGIIVAVKRLSAMQFPSHTKAFDRHMQLIGKLRHSHVVSLRAYCNANEEKLLVYDYMPNGSLQSLLQSNNGGLDWKTRKQILIGAAHGLNYIHTFPAARPPLVHASVKPSNILIDEQGNACISECGLMRFATNACQSLLSYPSSLLYDRTNCATTSNWHGYRAPELLASRGKATQESDVYSFGMVLLEVVTDKGVDDGECEGEVMEMVKIGMLCTAEIPEERPKMSQVLRMMSEFL